LAVAGGDEIISPDQRVDGRFRDRGPDAGLASGRPHVSFAANHPGAAPFSLTQMPYGPQVLWPTHCVQGTDRRGVSPACAPIRRIW
jgi:nicotinamidase/pyrazinamidase